MTKTELREIAFRLVSKGYSWEQIRWSDDLYYATPEEREICRDAVEECHEQGLNNFVI